MKRELLRWIAGLALILLAAPACQKTLEEVPEVASEEIAPRRGGEAVFATLSDISGVNELVASGTNFSADILGKLFLPLLREQPDYQEHPPTFAPALAESYEFSDDRLQLTFHLRQDALWSDGTPVTADDVRFTWQAQTAEAIAWDYAQVKDPIEDVEIVDPHTVRFHFERAYSAQLLDAVEGLVLPEHAWSELPFEDWRNRSEWFREHLVTNGPFLLESWEPQGELVLARNEHYFDPELPRLDRVVFRFLPDQRAQVTELLAGRLDLVSGLSVEDAALVEQTPDVDLLSYWHRAYTYLCWNTARPLFADPEVRRALTQAIDRELLIESIWGPYAQPSTSPIISTVWAHDETIEPWPYDPEAARRILAAKGFADSDGDGVLDRDGKPFAFEMTTNAGSTTRSDTLVLIQEQLARIGVRAEPRLMEINALIQSNLRHDFDATLGTWGIDTTLDLSYAFHSRSIDGGYNYGGYSNPEVDRLIDEAGAQARAEDAGPLLKEIQQILHEDQPYTFLWEPQRLVGIRSRLRDARPNPLYTYFDLEIWWLAE